MSKSLKARVREVEDELFGRESPPTKVQINAVSDILAVIVVALLVIGLVAYIAPAVSAE